MSSATVALAASARISHPSSLPLPLRHVRATHPATWLGADGLNAEASLFVEADQARQRGAALNSVNFARFVRDAVLLEGGNVREAAPDITELTLPSTWMPGLAGIRDPEVTTLGMLMLLPRKPC